MTGSKITLAWQALKATPNLPRSWSAWANDRSCLYVTLPEPDIRPDGRTIPIWDCNWTNSLNRMTPMCIEQQTNLRNAIAGKKPIRGFRVEMSKDEENVKMAHYGRLLPLTIIEQTPWKIVGQTDERIVVS